MVMPCWPITVQSQPASLCGGSPHLLSARMSTWGMITEYKKSKGLCPWLCVPHVAMRASYCCLWLNAPLSSPCHHINTITSHQCHHITSVPSHQCHHISAIAFVVSGPVVIAPHGRRGSVVPLLRWNGPCKRAQPNHQRPYKQGATAAARPCG